MAHRRTIKQKLKLQLKRALTSPLPPRQPNRLESNIQPKADVNSLLVWADFEKMFPKDEPLSTWAVQLFVAVNDLLFDQQLIMSVSARRGEPEGSGDAFHKACDLLYCFRVLTGHLNEAGNLIRKVEATGMKHLKALYPYAQPRKLEAIPSVIEGGEFPGLEVAFAGVHSKCTGNDKTHLWYRVLRPVRNAIGFHYNQDDEFIPVLDEMREQKSEALTVLTHMTGFSRYHFASVVAERIMSRNTLLPPHTDKPNAEQVLEMEQLSGAFIASTPEIVRFIHDFATLAQEVMRALWIKYNPVVRKETSVVTLPDDILQTIKQRKEQ